MGTTGLHVVHDTGIPNTPADYTTLILIHGYVWNSGMSKLLVPLDSVVLTDVTLEIFSKLIPVAKAQGTRLLLVNRRDYPGSIPYTEEELVILPASASTSDGDHLPAIRLNLLSYMRARAREVYDFLEELVRHDQVPPAKPKENIGGIVIAGWSFGSVWMLALLAFASSFPTTDVSLSKYVRRVICYGELWVLLRIEPIVDVDDSDFSYVLMGYPPPEDPYNPLFDPVLGKEEKVVVFNRWVTGYFSHGDSPDALERRKPLEDPSPTIERLTLEDLATCVYPPPGELGGSDSRLLLSAIKYGLFAILREHALYYGRSKEGLGCSDSESSEGVGDEWSNTELRFIWCEQSVWEVACGIWRLRAELEDAKDRNAALREIRIVRIKKGNHFVCPSSNARYVSDVRAVRSTGTIQTGHIAPLSVKKTSFISLHQVSQTRSGYCSCSTSCSVKEVVSSKYLNEQYWLSYRPESTSVSMDSAHLNAPEPHVLYLSKNSYRKLAREELRITLT